MSDIVWYRLPGGMEAHAFREGPGWSRSACTSVRFTVRLVPVAAPVLRCRACLAVVEDGGRIEPVMSEPEAREAFGA
jgi:hypothetical protein